MQTIRLVYQLFDPDETYGMLKFNNTTHKPQQKECCIQKKRRRLLPAADTLCVDQIVVDLLHSLIPDVVHPLHPQHLILHL